MPTARPLPVTSATTLGIVALRDRERQRSPHGKLPVYRRPRLAPPDRAPQTLELTDELELVARLDDALEADVVDPCEEGELAAVRFGGQHRHRTRLRHRLDHEDARHDRPARKVPREVPLVLTHLLAGNHAHARLEHGDLAQREEWVAVRDDLLDLPLAERNRLRHSSAFSSSHGRRRARARCT